METMHDNPAALAFIERGLILLSHLQGKGDVPMSEGLTLPLYVQDDGAIALGGMASNIENIAPAGREGLFRYAAEVGVGYELLPGFGLGVSVSGSRIIGPGIRSQAVATAFGMVYSPLPQISYAAVFHGGGNVRSGSTEGIPEVYLLDSRRTIEVGISMRHPSPLSMRKPILSLSLANEKIIGSDGLLYRGGIELFPFDFLALRAGYIVGGGIDRPTFGTGIIFGVVRTDYAFSREIDHAGHHALSISWEF